jgi:DNA polymerase delta subunit 2
MSASETSPVSRAYASFVPKWQRFTITDGASPGASAGTSGDGISPRSVTDGSASAAAAADAANANPYLRQYSHVYSRRLAALRDRCLANAASTKSKVVPRILELEEATPSLIVGTVAKDYADGNRPAVDTNYNSAALVPSNGYLGTVSPQDLHLEPLGTYCSPAKGGGGDNKNNKNNNANTGSGGDKLYLEDESGRVELVDGGAGVLDGNSLATGVVMAVEGSVREGTGILVVQAVHLPELKAEPKTEQEAQAEAETTAAATRKGPGSDPEGDPYLLLLSGLGCGGGTEGLDLRRDLVLDYLAGHSDAARDGARVARVVVAGGGCAGPAALAEIAGAIKTRAKGQTAGGGGSGVLASPDDPSLPVKELDLFLAELCASGVPVDYLPGRHDPTTAVWPQRPIHPCLLPVSSGYEGMLKRAPNPYEAEVGGKVVLGTDGRNVADLRRYMAVATDNATGSAKMDVDGEEGGAGNEEEEEKQQLAPPTALDALEATLNFAHVAPTGPDSLPTYPAFEDDPFVMDVRPDLYFAGNCDQYETRVTAQGTRLVCVPSFDATGKAVLVNLRTMDCEVIGFADA